MRTPSADIRLPDGTHLTLYRDVKCKRYKDNAELIGDWLVALVPGEPRAVLYVYQSDGKQLVEMIYNKHPHDQYPDGVLPDNVKWDELEWVFGSIDNKEDLAKYAKLYDAIRNHP